MYPHDFSFEHESAMQDVLENSEMDAENSQYYYPEPIGRYPYYYPPYQYPYYPYYPPPPVFPFPIFPIPRRRRRRRWWGSNK